MKNISIIIINYKTPDITLACLDSIFRNNDAEKIEVTVIDNASQDESVAKIKERYDSRINIIENQENLGFGKANNQGAKISQGKYLLFLNSDTIIEDEAIDKLASILDDKGEIGIISPSLMTSDRKQQADAYGKFPTLFRLIFKDRRRKETEPQNISEAIIKTDWVSGCAMMIRRNLFEQLKGFDENFFMYFEDVDICRRTREEGYKVVVSTDDSIIHLGGKSLSQNTKRKEYYYKSQDHYFEKWFGRMIKYIMMIARWPFKVKK